MRAARENGDVCQAFRAGGAEVVAHGGPLAARSPAMSEPRTLRCYEYVSRPYERVREALLADTSVFADATREAGARADALVTTLHAPVGVFDLGAEVAIQIHGDPEDVDEPGLGAVTRVRFGWAPVRGRSILPTMEATLSVYALSPTETQLDLDGRYRPPLGAVGGAIDALVLHRIAEASAHRFLRDLATRIADRI